MEVVFTNVKNYKNVDYKNVLIINPIIKNDDIELKDFFNSIKFKDFDGWFSSIQKDNLSKKDIKNFILVMQLIKRKSKYKKEAQVILEKLQNLLKEKKKKP